MKTNLIGVRSNNDPDSESGENNAVKKERRNRKRNKLIYQTSFHFISKGPLQNNPPSTKLNSIDCRKRGKKWLKS